MHEEQEPTSCWKKWACVPSLTRVPNIRERGGSIFIWNEDKVP